mgnify:CR=1 FL=1
MYLRRNVFTFDPNVSDGEREAFVQTIVLNRLRREGCTPENPSAGVARAPLGNVERQLEDSISCVHDELRRIVKRSEELRREEWRLFVLEGLLDVTLEKLK